MKESIKIAKELVKVAKILVAFGKKVSLEQIADIVRKRGSLTSSLRDFEALCGRKNVDLVDVPAAMGYRINKRVTEKGKDIVVISKSACTPSPEDIVVGGIVIGYM